MGFTYLGSAAPLDASLRVITAGRPEVTFAYANCKQIQFTWLPEEFTETVTPNWEEVAILGRSEPFHIYANTGTKTIELDLTFMAQGGAGDTVIQAIREEVLVNVRFLQSLAYPVRLENGLSSEPATCVLQIGSLIDEHVIMHGAPTVTFKGPWDVATLLPYQASVSCSFAVINHHPQSAGDIVDRSRIRG